MSGNTKFERKFKGSCVDIKYPCGVGAKFVDPCSCAKWYQCGADTTSFISQPCANGTFYNHETTTCQLDTRVGVVLQLCDHERPWKRCTDAVDLDALQQHCKPTKPSTPPGSQTKEQKAGAIAQVSGDNTGTIVGGVVGAIVIIALIAVLVFLFRKKGKPISHYINFATLKKKKEESSYVDYDNHTDNETYAEISDVVLNDPEYGKQNVPTYPSLEVGHGKVKGRAGTEEVAYDNPGYDKSNDTDGTIPNSSNLTASQQSEDSRSYLPVAPPQPSSSLAAPPSMAPSSFYTTGPPKMADDAHADEHGYQVPKAMPEYCDLHPEPNSVYL